MYYYLNYKGNKLGRAMNEEEAKAKLKLMESCFKGLILESVSTIQDEWPEHAFKMRGEPRTARSASQPHGGSPAVAMVK